ncbi:MAG: response regulator [Alphaproteobacteria bacterium]|nr:response regulator [Alphaproteobacteria bacterium]
MSKILVVEDNALNRRLFTDLLQTLHHDIIEATDGREALQLTKAHQPDLVLMDIQLPGLSGLEVTKKIRANKKIKQPKILAVSAFAMKQDAEKVLQSGCDDYISKPIAIGLFLQKVTEILQT